MIILYKIIGILIYPALNFILQKRLKTGKECKDRYTQKLGKNLPSFAKKSQTFWFCAASVGESLSVLPIIKELCERGNIVIITTTTLASANLLSQRLPQNAIHCFTPLDSAICIKRFLKHFRPDVFVLVEEEFWPNTIMLAKQFCKKCYFLNAKFSAKSTQKWIKYSIIKQSFINLLKQFDDIFVSANSSKKLFSQLSVKFSEIKSLKYYTINNFNPTMPQFDGDFNPLNQNTILALSTHSGEDELILQAFAEVKKRLPRPFLFLIPRHNTRTADICKIIDSMNLKYALLSNTTNIASDVSVFIIDKMGLVANYCLASKVIVVCGSLVDGIGGHNILEPASLSKPIITGAFNENFADIVSDMQKDEAICVLKATSQAEIVVELTTLIVKCFQNTTFSKELSENAKAHINKNASDYKLLCDKLQQ